MRKLDTSTLGPIRIRPPQDRQRARNLLADKISDRGSAWSNAAGNVRAGFENCWISAALDAIESILPADDE